jgi:hypothetical protein
MNEDLKWIILTIISVVAAVFSILTFKRNRRLENENHLYRIKMDSYAKVLGEITTFLNRLQDYLKQFKEYGSTPLVSTTTKNELNDLAKNVDGLIFAFDESVTKNSLVISQDVLSKLNLFSLKLFGTEIPEVNLSKQEHIVEKLDNYVAEIIIDANDINELMRRDLNIDELNLSLYRRIKTR